MVEWYQYGEINELDEIEYDIYTLYNLWDRNRKEDYFINADGLVLKLNTGAVTPTEHNGINIMMSKRLNKLLMEEQDKEQWSIV